MKPKQMEVFVDDNNNHWVGSYSDGGDLYGFRPIPSKFCREWEEEGIEVLYHDKPTGR